MTENTPHPPTTSGRWVVILIVIVVVVVAVLTARHVSTLQRDAAQNAPPQTVPSLK